MCNNTYTYSEAFREFIHDDITWCGNECSHTECERNQENRLNKTGLYSMAMFRDTETCPLTKKEESTNALDET